MHVWEERVLTPHPSPLTPRPSPLAPRPSPLTPHTSPLRSQHRDEVGSFELWLSADEDAEPRMRAAVAATQVRNAAGMANGADSMATARHSIAGLPLVTKPPDETGRGGSGPSLAGYGDGSREDLSLIHSIVKHRRVLTSANERSGVAGVLAALKTNAFPGGGGLCTERVLTYLEPTGLVQNVLKPWASGGGGSNKAILFASTVAGVDASEVKTLEVLEDLKKRLEMRNDAGDRRLAARFREVAKGCDALVGFEDVCAAIGSSLLTGGTMETFLCDVIWRLYRRTVLECEKPRLPPFKAETSAGNALSAFPIWGDDSVVHSYDLQAFLQKTWWAKKNEGVAAPKLEDFVLD